jgi:hypothetical protein
LKKNISSAQDQRIRKALYRLRQKGIEPQMEEKSRPIVIEPSRAEIFLLAENRLPLWQPFFYFRSNGARGDWFFAEIAEGKDFEIIQQQRDVRMNVKAMQRVAENYADKFRQGTGVPMAFLLSPPAEARYFLEKSFELLKGAEEFKRYIGEAPTKNPFENWNVATSLLESDAAILLSHDYFKLWLVEEDFLDSLLDRLQKVEEGPIILPEQQQKQQKLEVTNSAVEQYFSGTRRSIWTLVLEKAAYALQHQDREIAEKAVGFARMLLDTSVNVRSIALLWGLVDRSLEVRKQQRARKESEEKRTSLIMTPQEFQRTLKK